MNIPWSRRSARVAILMLAAAVISSWEGVHAMPVLGASTAASRIAHAGGSTAAANPAPRRAPTAPPLTTAIPEGAESEESESASPSTGDPLVSNGLGSPMCRKGMDSAELSQNSLRNCANSGFEAAPVPTGNYAFDVHINTGIAKLANDADATIQNVLQLAWTVLVSAVHGLIVMIEWCYTIDLIDSSAMGGVARGLRDAQTAFTQPWLALVLAVASVLGLYHGLVRRRVAETVGQAALMLAMMVGGLWVIVDPTGTIGSLGQWANQAGIGALGAVAGASPRHPERTLADAMGNVFSGTVGVPWCFMEFGDVGWCNDPARLDPRLRAAALTIAAREQAQIGCSNAELYGSCVRGGSAEAGALTRSAQELREARTNGELFLALPANEAMRNSINDSGSLFNLLCGGSETPCRGPTATQAEFRTEHGTEWRFMGLVFIWAGVLGMLLLLGFIAVHLLGAAIASLLYLLLAPAAVLAPALGDGGRAAFRGWATRLLAAVMAKLIYSFLLGVVLLMARILTVDLTALGWFTQWLLISTMWWGAFLQRHHVLDLALGQRVQRRETHSVARRVGRALETPRMMLSGAGQLRRALSRPAPSPGDRHARSSAVRERARSGVDEQVARVLGVDHRDAAARVKAAPELQEQLSARRAQLERLRNEHRKALGSGEHRRATRLDHRAQRVEAEIGRSQHQLNDARQLVADSEHARRAGGGIFTREQAEARAHFLDAQATLPPSSRALGPGGGELRDYPALAGLAGLGREAYAQSDPRKQRRARLEIDRELALRRELAALTGGLEGGAGRSSLTRRSERRLNREFESALERRMRDGGNRLPSSRVDPQGFERRWGSVAAGRAPHRTQSSVMRDAHEVSARRKRQLGRGPRA